MKAKLEQDEQDENSCVDVDGDVASSLGTELDEAFRRGRKYFTSGYSLSTSKSAVRKKSKEYRKLFVEGWQWQNDRRERHQ